MELNHRRCISCRKVAHRSQFWRVVRLAAAEDEADSWAIALDHGMGRSAYLCPITACLQAAQKKNRLGRALKAPIPAALYDTLNQRLTQSAPAIASACRQLPDNGPSPVQEPTER